MTVDAERTSDTGRSLIADVELLMAERAIRRVLHAYSRGVDRLDLEAVRACYWPEGTDDHGDYRGGVDGFIDFLRDVLARHDATNHFLGNTLIDVDIDAGVARSETYAIAHHRHTRRDGQPADMVAGLRYVDRFERRADEWRIAARVCAFDWWRNDPVRGDVSWGPGFVLGVRSSDDIVYHILETS
ncbi:MAG: nuclear transport factor 2 family protein [Actinomycetota bacterium]|jgi:ketosteroid isomerase-like protein|nr:nuclear transport factor 2 family protein [Actinomycetota bacterium]